MFSLRKLQRLPPRTRLRKLLVMIRDEEQGLQAGRGRPDAELASLLGSRAFLDALRPTARTDAEACLATLASRDAAVDDAVRVLNSLRHLILTELGVPWAEWDQLLPGAVPATPAAPPTARKVLPARVYLEDVRSPYNVGSIFRTAEAFGVEHVYLSPRTPLPTLARARRTSRGCSDVVPWSVRELRGLDGDDGPRTGAVFALETGGTPLDRFDFPVDGTVLVGSEELGLSPEALAAASRGAGRVSIPMTGGRASLNVAVAFGILMQAWHARLG
jgi:RNA methyltransferase, TrmH family